MAFLDDTASSIFDAIDQAWGSGSTSLANSVSVNIFAQNSSAPDFFDINLSRDIDLDGNTLGLFAISEHIPGFENVTQTPKLYRQNPDRWAIAMDSLQVNGQAFTFNKSSLSTIPAGKVGAVLDTGASLPQLPGPAIDFIYGSIPGALSDGDIGWIVPCYGTTNLTLTFGGQAIPIHPLDLTYIDFFVDPTSGMNITICRNAYNALSLGPNFTGFDLLLGDSFLRNVYASFDFGDAGTTNNSFIQLLPTTDPSAAWTEFVLARAETLAGLPPIADPPVLELLIEYETNSTSSNNSTSTGDAGDPTDSLSGAIQNDDITNSTPSSNYQTTDSDAVNLLDKYGPVVVGLLAGNILISLLLLIVGLVACTRGWMRKGARSAPSYVPVRLKEAAMAEDMDYRSSTSYNRP
ncbi:hypothetical protein PHLCEN_2v1498 [Hermanssonia centrifuga]|uniref:Peptidase A1 domain-containing protein n=1 Tax=Hermanssonia centrifuga TaxID=98765 RepID=A0A2R6RZS5_9APHY|nr:hypothetical protein PHLCEN_2v1498 [Hermanssonia centrifuga]